MWRSASRRQSRAPDGVPKQRRTRGSHISVPHSPCCHDFRCSIEWARFSGDATKIGSRVLSVARGGQVVVSGADGWAYRGKRRGRTKENRSFPLSFRGGRGDDDGPPCPLDPLGGRCRYPHTYAMGGTVWSGSYVGRRVPRREDNRLLVGRGRFAGNVRFPGMVHAEVIRSPIAHGRLVRCEPRSTVSTEAILDVITPWDAAEIRLPCIEVAPGQRQTSYRVLDEVIRYVGQPVAVVLAQSPEAARAAAGLINLDFDELPAVVGIEDAMQNGAPLLYPDWGTNVVTDFEIGDSSIDCDGAIAEAAQVVEMTFRFGRVSPYPLEPRGIVASYSDEELTIWTSTQAPHHVRDNAADALGLPHSRVRVISREVGGGFGGKDHLYPDELLVCLATIRLGRPVCWTELPTDRLIATLPARAAIHRGKLALDSEGNFVALHADIVGDLGGHPSNCGISPFVLSATMLPGPYRFERAGARVRGVVTTTTPTGSYRGFGQPEATWTRERLVDEAARRLGLDPVDIRLRNMVGFQELPYLSRTRQPYDSGDYPLALRTVESMVKPLQRVDGRRRGVGFACHVQATGMGPSMDMKKSGLQAGGFETAIARMEPDGSIVVSAGVAAIGQGLETTLAQIAADQIGVALDNVHVVLGDTMVTPYSSVGSVASRSLVVGGGALAKASARLRERIFEIASNQLEADPIDLEIVGSTVCVKGSPDVCRTLREIATSAWRGWDLPEGSPPGLEEQVSYEPAAFTFAYGAHAAAVAVDLETGMVEVEGYWLVNDSGVLINPAVVEGQLSGGVAQGVGMALMEEIKYSAEGQPSANYQVPTSRNIPNIEITLMETHSPLTPGGMKGVGEAGTIGPPAAIGNAVAAACPEIASRITTVPLVPSMLWSMLND